MLDPLSRIKFIILDVDGTMTDGGVYISDDGSQFKKYNARDGMAIQLMIKAGYHVGIISHSKSSIMVERRAQMLGIKYCYVGSEAKEIILKEWLDKLSLNFDQVCYIGDDINDEKIMSMVGVSVCPLDAVNEIIDISDIQLSRKGGDACIREFYDEYLKKVID